MQAHTQKQSEIAFTLFWVFFHIPEHSNLLNMLLFVNVLTELVHWYQNS